MKINRFLLVLLASFTFASKARSDTLRWVCAYDAMATPSGVQRESFKLEFALDTLSKKAVLIGNAGLSDVAFFNGDDAITFQEKLATGAIQTTTISHTNGRSVHSRHSILSGRFVPSQYYGACK